MATQTKRPRSRRPDGIQPFSPLQHCPQCDGAIDPRCVRVTPQRVRASSPRRCVEAWCDHCKLGYQAMAELSDAGTWTVIAVHALRGDRAYAIRTYADEQTNVTRGAQ